MTKLEQTFDLILMQKYYILMDRFSVPRSKCCLWTTETCFEDNDPIAPGSAHHFKLIPVYQNIENKVL